MQNTDRAIYPAFLLQFNRLPQSPPSLSKTVQTDQAYVAASIVTTALEFRNLIIKGELVPEPAGKEGGELCMESFKWSVSPLSCCSHGYSNDIDKVRYSNRAFNACRVPASPGDYAVKIAEDSKDGQHMVIVRNNQFFKVDLADQNGKQYSTEEFKR